MNLYIQEPQKSRLKWSSDYLNKLFSTIFVLKSNSRINLYDYFFCPGLLALFSVSLGSNPIKIRPNRFDFIIYIDHTSWLGISTMRWWAIPRDPVSLHMCRLRGDPRTLAMLCAPSRNPNDVAATGRRWQLSAEVSHLRREASRILVIFWGHSSINDDPLVLVKTTSLSMARFVLRAATSHCFSLRPVECVLMEATCCFG